MLCSYSSNRYPAETDQREPEMRNINEEAGEQRVRGGNDAEVDFTSLPAIPFPLCSVSVPIISSHLCSILQDFVISFFTADVLSLPIQWCNSVHFY